MPMERSSSTGLRSNQSGRAVVAIECLTGSSKADEWNGEMPQTGDVVEELRLGGDGPARAPFRNGRAGVQRLLHSAYKRKETSDVLVRVRRGQDQFIQLQACIVPCEPASSGAHVRRPVYLLRSINDPNYAVTFVDSTEGECMILQGTRSSRVVSALSKAQLQDGYVSYPWEKKMRETLPVPNSSAFLSLLLLPKVTDQPTTRYNDLDDTLARANAWLSASQAAGVPILFMNIQTEALLTKISGETASSTVNTGSLSDLSNLANASLYGFEDYHGVDIGVVKAVRLWYAPIAGEVSMEIKLQEGDSRLGFAISRTEEGFIYVSSVADDADDGPAVRSGLREVYKEALRSSKLVVISRLSNEKVLPWLVSSSGAVRCYDTISLSQKLSLHRHALRPILLHLFMWDRSVASDIVQAAMSARPRPQMPLQHSPTTTHHLQCSESASTEQEEDHNPDDEEAGSRPARDTAGDLSFRFHNFGVSTNWV